MPWDRFMPFIQVLFIVLMKRFYSTSLCPWDLTSTLTRAKKLVIFVARTWQPASALFYQMEYIWGGWAGEQGVTKAEIRPARPNYGRKLAAKRRRCGIFSGANIYWRRMEIKVDFSRLWSMREATISKTQRCRGFSSPTKSSAGNLMS